MELITAVNSNLNNKNNILYCPPGLLLTKYCFTGHSTNLRRMIPVKGAGLSFPYRIRAHIKRKMGCIFDPLLTASLTMTITSRKLYPTKENSQPYIFLGMLLLKS